MLAALKRSLFAGLAAGALAVLPLSHTAASTSTATFTVTAEVSTSCFIQANNLNFGVYTGTAEIDQTTTLQVLCSTSTPYTIGLDQGTSAGATVTTRAMTGPGPETLGYSLHQTSSTGPNWGNTPPTDTEAGVGTGAQQTFTVFGVLPAGEFVEGGNYSDTITATLEF